MFSFLFNFLNMRPLPGLLVIQIQIQAVCLPQQLPSIFALEIFHATIPIVTIFTLF